MIGLRMVSGGVSGPKGWEGYEGVTGTQEIKQLGEDSGTLNPKSLKALSPTSLNEPWGGVDPKLWDSGFKAFGPGGPHGFEGAQADEEADRQKSKRFQED